MAEESYNQSFFSIGPGSADRRAGTRDIGTQKDRANARGEATGGAYVYKGKGAANRGEFKVCLLYTSPSPRD